MTTTDANELLTWNLERIMLSEATSPQPPAKHRKQGTWLSDFQFYEILGNGNSQ